MLVVTSSSGLEAGDGIEPPEEPLLCTLSVPSEIFPEPKEFVLRPDNLIEDTTYVGHLTEPHQDDLIRIGVNTSDAAGAYLYFPWNAKQPTTKEAVIWSCANKKEEGITEWYMKMFGWKASKERTIKAGFDEHNSPQPIFKIHNSMYHMDPHSINKTTEDLFWNTFHQIAANPVGRILLYRLLIEIWRVKNDGSKTGTPEFIERGAKTPPRPRFLSIELPEDFVWKYQESGTLLVTFNPICTIATKVYQDGKEFKTGWGTTPISVYLFHEMLHWFHVIRYPSRFSKETRQVFWKDLKERSSHTSDALLNFYFGKALFVPTSEKFSDELWALGDFGKKTDTDDETIKLEELRTVLGINNITSNEKGYIIKNNDYLEGDDLSENLYSCSLNHQIVQHSPPEQAAMRYGHSLRIIEGQHTPQIKLAHKVTIETMQQITPDAAGKWQLKEGEALIRKDWEEDFKALENATNWMETMREIGKAGKFGTFNPFKQIPSKSGCCLVM